MNSFELDSGFELQLPSDDEYLDMKEAYKFGKLCYYFKDPDPRIPSRFTDVEKEHYMNGWLYQQWLEKEGKR